jgi:hypothetical protein
MPHPTLDNDTPLVVAPLVLEDENGRPSVTLLVRAAFEILDGGILALMEEQPPLCAAGEFWGDPDTSSYKYEPEVAPVKLATDVAFIAHAWAPTPRTTTIDIGVQVGALKKGLRVFGERVWVRAAGAVLTNPLPFERIPVSYDRAFGGWDRTSPDPAEHVCERRNPIGRGFHGRHNRPRDGDYAPNVEDPAALIADYDDTPAPVGIGFTSPGWIPRAKLGGTYDEAWTKDRKPLLPKDFDRRFFSAASPGLVAPGFMRGDESVHTLGLTKSGRLSFRLPGLPPPALRVAIAGLEDQHPIPNLDTIIVDLDLMRLTLLWRTRLRLPEGAHDLRAIELRSPEAKKFPRTHAEPPVSAANASVA